MEPGRDVFERSSGETADAGQSRSERPWLGVYFQCAGAYLRVLRNASGTGYLARCPRCSRTVQFRVGKGGTAQRFFEVSC